MRGQRIKTTSPRKRRGVLQRGRVMGLILDFNEHASKAFGKTSRGSASGSAEIVIFPGVRYERWEGDQEGEDESTTLHRDRIELPD